MSEPQGRFYPDNDEGVARSRFGYRANRVGFITIPLDVAQTRAEIKIGGNFLWCQRASSRNALAQIAFDDNSAQEGGVTFREGSAVGGVPFSSIFVTNTAQPGESLKLMYIVGGDGNVRIENAGSISTTVDLSRSANLADAADAVINNAAVATIAANATRRSVIIGSLAANGGILRVGNNPGAARGQELKPGESITFDTTGIVKVANNSGAPCTITVVEVTD